MSHTMKRVLQTTLRQLGLQEKGGYKGFIVLNGPQGSRFQFSTSVSCLDKKISSSEFMDNRLSLGFGDKSFGSFEKVTPHTVSERRVVPEYIARPDYYFREDGTPAKKIPKKPGIKTKDEVALIQEACEIARLALDLTIAHVKPGITTDELDKFAHNLIIKNNAYPSALGYKKFPKSICTSVNNVACHGIPDSRKLVNGDLITIDVMAYKKGFHGDCAATTIVGSIDTPGKQLLEAAKACLAAGIERCGPNKPFYEIGKAIEECARTHKMTVLHAFTGHGLGRNIHELPDIYHYDRSLAELQKPTQEVMKPGMVFTVEPVIAQGMDMVMVLSDGWTAVTVDGGRAAQFEHTIHITDTGYEILTDRSLAFFILN